MKALLVIVAIVAILALVGWITFGSGDDSASLTIETEKIKQDTREAVREGGEFIEDTRRELREEFRDDEAHESSPTDEPPAADAREDGDREIERERQDRPEHVRDGTSWTQPRSARRPESLRV